MVNNNRRWSVTETYRWGQGFVEDESELPFSDDKYHTVNPQIGWGCELEDLCAIDFEFDDSFTEEEKELLLQKLKSKLTKENVLLLSCDESRSQHKNKEIVVKRFLTLIISSLKIPKKRKATKPSKSSIQKRLDKKKKLAYKKALRNKPEMQ